MQEDYTHLAFGTIWMGTHIIGHIAACGAKGDILTSDWYTSITCDACQEVIRDRTHASSERSGRPAS